MDTGRRVNVSIKGKKNQWKGGSQTKKVLNKENNKNTKLLGRCLKTGTTHVASEEGLARYVKFNFM